MPVHQRFGLALSGGGFRASFFHLGVLRRLAELDLLRHLTDISTVSGGSILAAHYYLHFKLAFEKARGDLKRDDYIQIVDEVAEEFIRGNSKDLRNRLLMKPMTHINALVLGRGYGRPMANLYSKYFYGSITSALFHNSRLSGATDYEKNGIPLHQAITLRPDQTPSTALPNKSSGYPDSSDPELALADFNRHESYATIPRLVLNATCLNTGGPFQFMLNEIGGSDIGYVRYDELFMLLQYKMLVSSTRSNFDLDYFNQVIEEAFKNGEDLERKYDGMPKTAFKKEVGFPAHTAEHLAFYLAGRRILKSGEIVPDPWLPEPYGTRNAVLTWLRTFKPESIPPPRRPDPRLPDRPSPHDRLLLRSGSNLMGRLSAAYPLRAACAALLFGIFFSLPLLKHPTISDVGRLYEADLSQRLPRVK